MEIRRQAAGGAKKGMGMIYTIDKYGVRFDIKTGLVSHDVELCERLIHGNWEEKTFAFIKENANPESVYIDLGAWIGTTCLFASRLYGKCFAVEPNLQSFESLHENCALNGNTNLTISNIAIMDYNGDGYFVSDNIGNPITTVEKLGEEKDMIRCLRLSSFLTEHKIQRVDFIKMDVEGAEYKILPDIKDLIRDLNYPAIHLSLHPCLVTDRKICTDIAVDFLSSYVNVSKEEIALINNYGLSEIRVVKNSIKINSYDN